LPRYRQITCLTEAKIEKRDVVIPSDTRFDIPAGETKRLCDIKGPGRIVRIWVTLPTAGRGPVLRDAVLRMFWDNEDTPSVECPLGDFFGAAFGRPRRFAGERLAIAGGGYVCLFDMPFDQRAVIEVENQSDRDLRLLVFQIGYFEDDAPHQDLQTFHAQWRRENPTTEGKSFTALEAAGKGRLVGLKLDMQNRSWWLSPNIKKMLFPRGLGLGMLEGPETISIDGESAPSIVGTGTEDFFQGGWYFKGGVFDTPNHGVTVRSFPTGRVSAYRFLLHDPIPFETSIAVRFDHGVANDMATDYASVAYWYQSEPHSKFPELLPRRDRHPTSTLTNLLQPLLAAAIFGGLLAAAALLLWNFVLQ